MPVSSGMPPDPLSTNRPSATPSTSRLSFSTLATSCASSSSSRSSVVLQHLQVGLRLEERIGGRVRPVARRLDLGDRLTGRVVTRLGGHASGCHRARGDHADRDHPEQTHRRRRCRPPSEAGCGWVMREARRSCGAGRTLVLGKNPQSEERESTERSSIGKNVSRLDARLHRPFSSCATCRTSSSLPRVTSSSSTRWSTAPVHRLPP